MHSRVIDLHFNLHYVTKCPNFSLTILLSSYVGPDVYIAIVMSFINSFYLHSIIGSNWIGLVLLIFYECIENLYTSVKQIERKYVLYA